MSEEGADVDFESDLVLTDELFAVLEVATGVPDVFDAVAEEPAPYSTGKVESRMRMNLRFFDSIASTIFTNRIDEILGRVILCGC